jgi:hypothetical protein
MQGVYVHIQPGAEDTIGNKGNSITFNEAGKKHQITEKETDDNYACCA